MTFHYADTLEKHNGIHSGIDTNIYHVTPTIAIKAVCLDQAPNYHAGEHPLLREIAFLKRLNQRQDRCAEIVEHFLVLPDHIFLSYCANGSIYPRLRDRQERETGPKTWYGRLIRVKGYEDPALVARWIQQLSSALAYVEKMGFCHNDVHAGNCFLDKDYNLKLGDFGRATDIGQFLDRVLAPRARLLNAGPLEGSFGLCSARTEQFALGTLLYFLVYGYEPYDNLDLCPKELDRRLREFELPELDRHEVFDGLISACWHNVYPTMALTAYDFKRKTKDIASVTPYQTIDRAKEIRTCEALVQKGILGPELAVQFQPFWLKYLYFGTSIFIWRILFNIPRRIWLGLWYRFAMLILDLVS
ncbi:hypothetical protein FQN57_001105 [Myotisia sp. PD_48]|nr:hypothetical protein FQN57_001105 [Myotisia sp. PD_48]